jgi:hypothetical protein
LIFGDSNDLKILGFQRGDSPFGLGKNESGWKDFSRIEG